MLKTIHAIPWQTDPTRTGSSGPVEKGAGARGAVSTGSIGSRRNVKERTSSVTSWSSSSHPSFQSAFLPSSAAPALLLRWASQIRTHDVARLVPAAWPSSSLQVERKQSVSPHVCGWRRKARGD